jgi:hypothetical protein
MLSFALTFFRIFATIVNGDVINILLNRPVSSTWFEVGFSTATNQDWTQVKTNYNFFVAPLIFISNPDLSQSSNFPILPRVRNTILSGSLSFQVKLYLPNDSYCGKQWYIPQYMPIPKSVTWAVFEQGAYNISGNAVYLSSGLINRASATGKS